MYAKGRQKVSPLFACHASFSRSVRPLQCWVHVGLQDQEGLEDEDQRLEKEVERTMEKGEEKQGRGKRHRFCRMSEMTLK